MGTYFISFIAAVAILSCFFHNAYAKRFIVVSIAALIAFIPLTVMNGVKSSTVKRTTETTEFKELCVVGNFSLKIDSVKRVYPLFIEINKNEISIIDGRFLGSPDKHSWNINKVHISFINPCPLNQPRLKITEDFVSSEASSIWFSKQGIPSRNEQTYLYLPDDVFHHFLVNKARAYGKK